MTEQIQIMVEIDADTFQEQDEIVNKIGKALAGIPGVGYVEVQSTDYQGATIQ